MKAKPMNSKKHPFKDFIAKFTPYFRTVYSNPACIECGTTKPWYWAILVFLLSLILSTIPLTVIASQQQGSTYVSGTTYGFKEAFVESVLGDNFVEVQGTFKNVDIKDSTATFTVSDNAVEDYNGTEKFYYLGYHESLYNSDKQQNVYKRDLDVYFVKDDSIYSFNEIISEISNTMYEYLGHESGVNYKGSHVTPRTSSYLILAKNYIGLSIYQVGDTSSTAKTAFAGDFQYLENTNLNDYFLKNTDGLEGTDLNEQVFTNLKTFLDLTYFNNRTVLIGVQSGLSLGVNAGITLLLGLIIFLMTRGKSNPNRTIKWYQCFLISFYATFTPALLSLCFGFLMPSMAIMLFVMTFGFRVMWMSMKNLRPQYE